MLKVFAPAKVNLHLHVTGRRADGYHDLDSLVAFADIGDVLFFERARNFSFSVDGQFAGSFLGGELDTSPQSKNLVVKAAWAISNLLARELNVEITLQKNLPLGSGLGGGSADAAACLWGLCQYWGLSLPPTHLASLASQLGSDVPVCLNMETAIMRGTGDQLSAAPAFPELPVLLVWPGRPVATKDVFTTLGLKSFSRSAVLPENFESVPALCEYLKRETTNDLAARAGEILPVIRTALNEISIRPGCGLARLSGSGSTCFGIFNSQDQCQSAAETLAAQNPGWWIRTGWLNRVSRY